MKEKFTNLPIATSSLLTDIIAAVQGGILTQQTLQKVYNLFQSNIILYNSGNPNGNVAGNTYQFCWDTLSSILYLCTFTGTSTTAVWTMVNQEPFVSVTSTSQQMRTGLVYQANNSSLVTFTLPTTSNLGDTISVTGFGSGGWTIVQNTGQQIIVGNSITTITTGSISSTNQYNGIKLYCVVEDTIWQTISSPSGTLTIV